MRGMGRHLAIAWAVFLLLVFPASSNAVDFTPATTYPVGTFPSFIVVGDFNGDGKLDLAVANSNSNNISILVNNGDGTFKPAVNSPAGTSPQAMAAGDFDGNGTLDLVVTNAGDSSQGRAGAVFLLLGNGDGSFQTAVQLQADQFPLSSAAADLNGDGKVDLILGDGANGSVTILLGKGDGTFHPSSTVMLASTLAVSSLLTADFNADKNVDIVAAVANGPVFVLLGNGDGSFHTPAPIVTAGTSPHLLVGDFNGDGKLDLVLRSGGPRPPVCRPFCLFFDRVTILTGKGDGTFNSATPVLNLFNSSLGNLAAGDFNADGKQDLIVPRGSGLLFLGRNDGTFLALPPLWTGLGVFAAAASLNSDSLPDLAVTDVVNNAVAVFLNTSPTSGADLAVSEPATANVVIGGDNLTYTATVLNQGPQDATDVTLKETLPATFTAISAQPSQGTCSGTTTITCALGAMADPSSATVDFTVKPTSPGIFTDGLQITATQPDLNSKNNSASMTVTAVLPADLAVSGAASETVAKIGDNVSFTITITNHGPGTANNVSLTDSLSDPLLQLTSLAISQGSCAQQITCSIGTLASGASVTLTFVVAMTTAEILANNVNVGSDQPDLNGDNNNATITVAVNPADLIVTQTASATSITKGTQLTFTLAVANKGPAAANNVTLTEALQGGGTMSPATSSQGSCSAPSGGQITCNLGMLAASATAAVTIKITFTEVGQWTTSASTFANEPDPDGSNNSANLNVDVIQEPDFAVSPASPSLTVPRGAAGTDTMTLTSLGGFSAAVSLACSVSGPNPLPSCSMSPTSVTPGTNPVTSTLTFNAPLLARLVPSRRNKLLLALSFMWLPLSGIALFGARLSSSDSTKRARTIWLVSSLTLVLLAFLAGCGGGSSMPPPTAQSYAVTVTASSGAISKSIQVQVTVR